MVRSSLIGHQLPKDIVHQFKELEMCLLWETDHPQYHSLYTPTAQKRKGGGRKEGSRQAGNLSPCTLSVELFIPFILRRRW